MMPFLSFPGEIRNQIYRLALVETAAWQRRHSALCEYRPTEESDVPIPPYALIIQHATRRLPVCPCTKRKTLGLLRVCRQINQEAGGLFWSENSFIFSSHRDFVMCILNTSNRTCMLIRSVVVINRLRMPVAHTNNLSEPKTARLWAGIFRLQDLRVLHLDPGYLDFGGKLVERIPLQLPELKTLWATTLHARAYCAQPGSVPGLNLTIEDTPSRLPSIYFLSSLSVRWRTDQFPPGSNTFNGSVAGGFTALDDSITSKHIMAELLDDWITDELQITPASAWSPEFPELFEYIVPRSHFPYEEVQQYIEIPGTTFDFGDRHLYVETLGLPASQEELAEDARRVDINRRLSEGLFAQTWDALVHSRMWDCVRRMRDWDLAKRWFIVVAFFVAIEICRKPTRRWAFLSWFLRVYELAYIQDSGRELELLIRRAARRRPPRFAYILGNGVIVGTSLMSHIIRLFIGVCYGAQLVM